MFHYSKVAVDLSARAILKVLATNPAAPIIRTDSVADFNLAGERLNAFKISLDHFLHKLLSRNLRLTA